jgi:hypothetical protein
MPLRHSKEITMDLSISLDSLCRITARLREYEALVPTADPDEGSNPTDDGGVAVLDESADRSVEEELRAAIDDLADDEQQELVALALVGRGAYDVSEWEDALADAEEEAGDVADWVLSTPMAAAYLETGMAAFDLNCDDAGQLS